MVLHTDGWEIQRRSWVCHSFVCDFADALCLSSCATSVSHPRHYCRRATVGGNLAIVIARAARKALIDFCKSKTHTPWPSSPIVHVDYPRMLFANARSRLGSWHYYPGSATGFPAPCVNSCNTRSASAVGAMHNDLDGVARILQEVSCWVCTTAPHAYLAW